MKDVLSVSKKPAAQSHRSPKRPEKGAPKNTRPSLPASAFLPTTRAEADARGWGQLDFVYVSGDAYVDHPSFGSAIITRVLESHGYKVGFIAQPDWNDPESVAVFGEPRLGFLVSAGNMDSMVNHYTVNKKRRRDDAYTPGGKGGARPNHAAVVYSNLIRRTFKETPIILGGIEASLRRLAHYDYWSDSLKRSILLDSGADLISYGMGERSIVEIADALAAGLSVSDLTFIDGTVFRTRSLEHVVDYEMLPSWEEVSGDKRAFAESFAAQYRASDPVTGARLVEAYPHGVYVVQNPPAAPLTQNEMDAVYRLPYARTWHPSYDEAGGVPALSEVKFSLTSCRGCFGECAFCALTFHQGRIVTGRSHESLLEEARVMTQDADFKGYIHDVGGPTANFRGPACAKQRTRGACTDRRCLGTKPCPAMKADHRDCTGLLRKLRKLPGGARRHGQAASGRLRRVLRRFRGNQSGDGQEAVRRALSHVVASGQHVGRGHRVGRVRARHGLQPRASAGFLPHALDDFHVHVLHGPRSAHHGTHLRAEDLAREGPATGAHPVPQPRELRPGARGPGEGRPARSYRLGRAVPHPPHPSEAERGESPERRWPARSKAKSPTEKTPAPRQAPKGQRPQRRHPQEPLGPRFPTTRGVKSKGTAMLPPRFRRTAR